MRHTQRFDQQRLNAASAGVPRTRFRWGSPVPTPARSGRLICSSARLFWTPNGSFSAEVICRNPRRLRTGSVFPERICICFAKSLGCFPSEASRRSQLEGRCTFPCLPNTQRVHLFPGPKGPLTGSFKQHKFILLESWGPQVANWEPR